MIWMTFQGESEPGIPSGPQVPKDRQPRLDRRPDPPPGRVGDRLDVREHAVDVQDRRHRDRLLRLFVDQQHRADAAVWMASALERAPIRLHPAEQVLQVRKRPRGRQRIPVAHHLADTGLVLHVVREMRKRVPLLRPGDFVDVLVAAGEGDRLESHRVDLVDVLDRESHDVADLVVVHAVDDRRDERDVDTVLVKVLDCAELHVVKVADLAVLVVHVAHPVELEVGKT